MVHQFSHCHSRYHFPSECDGQRRGRLLSRRCCAPTVPSSLWCSCCLFLRARATWLTFLHLSTSSLPTHSKLQCIVKTHLRDSTNPRRWIAEDFSSCARQKNKNKIENRSAKNYNVLRELTFFSLLHHCKKSQLNKVRPGIRWKKNGQAPREFQRKNAKN